jgi:outer membrane protein OmpA-like peptidoglycan-associated protein
MRGDTQEVRTLTQARAMVVRDYLVNNFRMDDTRVKTLGMGKREGSAEEPGAVDVVVYAEAR